MDLLLSVRKIFSSSFPRRREPSDLALADNLEPEIVPIRVRLFDHANLPCSVPLLDLLFTDDCGFHRAMQLIPDQLRYSMRLGESFDPVFSVLPDPTGQVAGNSDIERTVAFAG